MSMGSGLGLSNRGERVESSNSIAVTTGTKKEILKMSATHCGRLEVGHISPACPTVSYRKARTFPQ